MNMIPQQASTKASLFLFELSIAPSLQTQPMWSMCKAKFRLPMAALHTTVCVRIIPYIISLLMCACRGHSGNCVTQEEHQVMVQRVDELEATVKSLQARMPG